MYFFYFYGYSFYIVGRGNGNYDLDFSFVIFNLVDLFLCNIFGVFYRGWFVF